MIIIMIIIINHSPYEVSQLPIWLYTKHSQGVEFEATKNKSSV